MITYRKLTWFLLVRGQWQERYTDRLTPVELALWKGARVPPC